MSNITIYTKVIFDYINNSYFCKKIVICHILSLAVLDLLAHTLLKQ